MAEFINPQADVFGEGYKPDSKVALLEIHRLVCMFLASKEFAARRNGPHDAHHWLDDLQEPEEEEITRILLATAITARVIDDLNGQAFDIVAPNCGLLLQGAQTQPLTIREAFNKIIHALKIRFDVELNDQGQRYLEPFVYLYGKKGNVEWKATLDVIEYARAYVVCM